MFKRIYYLLINWFGDKQSKLLKFLSIYLNECQTIIDIGCGPSPYINKVNKFHFVLGMDAFYEACVNISKNNIYDQVINAKLPFIPIKSKSLDAVVFLQVIEHLEKNEGYTFIKQAEEIAKKLIIITTPNGYVAQEAYNGNPFQLHKSGWSIDELNELGYSVYGFEGLKLLYKKGTSKLIYPPIFWAKMINLGIFESLIRRKPQLAFQLIAIKYLESYN